MDGLET